MALTSWKMTTTILVMFLHVLFNTPFIRAFVRAHFAAEPQFRIQTFVLLMSPKRSLQHVASTADRAHVSPITWPIVFLLLVAHIVDVTSISSFTRLRPQQSWNINVESVNKNKVVILDASFTDPRILIARESQVRDEIISKFIMSIQRTIDMIVVPRIWWIIQTDFQKINMKFDYL